MKRLRLLLFPFSLFYWLIIALRNLFFDIGLLKISKVGVPVVSIGNISAGGVGKTPVVEMLIEKLCSGRRLAIVSRGYGRKTKNTVIVCDGNKKLASAEEAGDEPSQIAGKFPGLVIVVDEQRVRGAKKAVDLGAELILLDDAFQHRYLYRDIDIVIVTAKEILNGDRLLPAGNRREPMASLGRSDVIMVSRCHNIPEFEKAASILGRFNKPIIGVQVKLRSLRRAQQDRPARSLNIEGKKLIAFSGIGDNGSFYELLMKTKSVVAKNFVFQDHHWYSGADLEKIAAARREFKADYIVTTEKDDARLQDRFSGFLKNEEVLVAEICQEIIHGEGRLHEVIKNKIQVIL